MIRKKRTVSERRLDLQVYAIFFITITVLMGSALFFFYLHTDAMMRTTESETTLSSAFLASDISSADVTTLEGMLSERFSQVLDETGKDIDIWVTDEAGNTVFASGELPRAEVDTALASMEEGTDLYLAWTGRRNLFQLNQELFLLRRLPDSGHSIMMLNHCGTAHATQRQQFALFAGIEIVLMSMMLVLLTNTISAYRRQLIRLATTDELTGLSNRKSFQQDYAKFVSEESVRPFSLFLADIDFFKQVNDTYGHAIGDKALQTMGEKLLEMRERCGGFVGRWGGDEFIGVLPLGSKKAYEALSELCKAVREAKCAEGANITISVGLAESDGEVSLARLTEKADQALYISKESGRNRATAYDPSMVYESADVKSGQSGDEARAAFTSKGETVLEKTVSIPDLTIGERMRIFIREKLFVSILHGVKWMAPFVAGGGLLIGLAFLFDAVSVNLAELTVAERANLGSITPQAAIFKTIGSATFNFMLPVFAGFMAYSLAGEQAFMAGFVGGYMTIGSQSGFIGAMIAGLCAGLLAGQTKQFTSRMPKLFQKAAPILIYPIFNLLLMYAVSNFLITPVSAAVGTFFKMLLDKALAAGDLYIGILSGSMMAMDMGGIINKVAYNYAVAGLADGQTRVMASVMVGGMVPPIGIALSILMFGRKYHAEERERFAGTLFMGLSFITEGALPFVFTDFIRVIPACTLGSAIAGMLSEVFGCALPAPHGGIFVLPVMEHPLLYLLAITVGASVTAFTLGMLKRPARTR